MKVLMTTDAVGGVWTYALDLARGLAAADATVVLAVMGPPPRAEQLAQAAKVPGLVVEHRPYRLEWMKDPWDDVAAAGQSTAWT
jgi:glycogen synthase